MEQEQGEGTGSGHRSPSTSSRRRSFHSLFLRYTLDHHRHILEHLSQGRTELLEWEMEKGGRVDPMDWGYQNADGVFTSFLFELCNRSGNEEMIKKILDDGRIDPNLGLRFNGMHQAPLFKICETGNLTYLELLLTHPKINVNAMMPGEKFAVMKAIEYRQPRVVERLLQVKNLQIHAINNFGETPFMLSLESRQREITELLVSHPDFSMRQEIRGDLDAKILKLILDSKNLCWLKRYLAELPEVLKPASLRPHWKVAVEKKNWGLIDWFVDHPTLDVFSIQNQIDPFLWRAVVDLNLPLVERLLVHPKADVGDFKNRKRAFELCLAYPKQNILESFLAHAHLFDALSILKSHLSKLEALVNLNEFRLSYKELLIKFRDFPVQTMLECRQRQGWHERIFWFSTLHAHGYLALCSQDLDAGKIRLGKFFELTSQLPLELLMMISFKVLGLSDMFWFSPNLRFRDHRDHPHFLPLERGSLLS